MSVATTYKLKQPIPVVQTRDIAKSLDFYCKHFGFQQPWNHEGMYGGASKDGMHVHFMAKEEPKESMIYHVVEGVDALYESVQDSGLEIASPLTDQFYGMREFTVKDPDGNFVMFSQELNK